MNNSNKPTLSHAGLVDPNKSSRLRAMREQGRAQIVSTTNARQTPAECKGGVSRELQQARALLDQRLAEILALLPAGKQSNLFKIRYGITPEQIKTLPIKQSFSLLQIPASTLNMKLIADLTYNGSPAGKP